MRSAFYENKTAPYQMFASHTLTDAPHLHKEIEIVYVREGGVMAHADKNCEFIAKDGLFISFPNRFTSTNPVRPGIITSSFFCRICFSG